MNKQLDTTAIKKEIYPLVEKKLSTSQGVKKYKDCVQRYINTKPQLFETIPNDRLFFGADQIDDFFRSMGITEKEVKEGLSHTFFWKMNYSPSAAKDPFTVTALMVVRYFLLNKKQKEAELAAIYLACSGKFYPSAHYNSFRFLPEDSDAIMNFVLNTKLNQRFDLKREGSVFGTLRSICTTWLATYPAMFKSCTDDEVGYLIKQLQSRIKSFLKNFASLYYDAYKDKEYINFEADNTSDDNFHVVDTDTLRAERCAEKAMTYITSHSVDYGICTKCADQNVKKDEIKSIMESILNNTKNITEMKELISLIVSDYMVNGKDKDVRSIEFISHSIRSKPNVKDPNLVRIKEIIYTWLEDNSTNYRRRKKRVDTRNSYFKGVLEYVVLIINKANK